MSLNFQRIGATCSSRLRSASWWAAVSTLHWPTCRVRTFRLSYCCQTVPTNRLGCNITSLKSRSSTRTTSHLKLSTLCLATTRFRWEATAASITRATRERQPVCSRRVRCTGPDSGLLRHLTRWPVPPPPRPVRIWTRIWTRWNRFRHPSFRGNYSAHYDINTSNWKIEDRNFGIRLF